MQGLNTCLFVSRAGRVLHAEHASRAGRASRAEHWLTFDSLSSNDGYNSKKTSF